MGPVMFTLLALEVMMSPKESTARPTTGSEPPGTAVEQLIEGDNEQRLTALPHATSKSPFAANARSPDELHDAVSLVDEYGGLGGRTPVKRQKTAGARSVRVAF